MGPVAMWLVGCVDQRVERLPLDEAEPTASRPDGARGGRRAVCVAEGDLLHDGLFSSHLTIETDDDPPYHELHRETTFDYDRVDTLDTTWTGDAVTRTVYTRTEGGSSSISTTDLVDGHAVHLTVDGDGDGVVELDRVWTWDGDELLDELTDSQGSLTHVVYVYVDGLLARIDYDDDGDDVVDRSVIVTHPDDHTEVRSEDWYYYDGVADYTETIVRLYDGDGVLASEHRVSDELWTPSQNDGYEYRSFVHGQIVSRDAGFPDLGALQVETWGRDAFGRELVYTNTERYWTGETGFDERIMDWDCD